MKGFFGFLFSRRVAVFLGVVVVCLLIWFVGPLIAVASYRPLESETVRWICIALVVLIYVGRIVWGLVTAWRANAQLMQGLAKPAADAPPVATAQDAAAAEEVSKLQKRFEEAVAVLKRSTEKKSGLRTLVPGKQYLYDLPWYIFIGAPGSGKTTALVNSGIRFPLAQELGQEKIRGIGGTRNCDWWFADEAVFLDTAGRYTTQESDRDVDRSAWNGFIGLLKKYRPRRPINGVIVTVSVADLLEQDKASIEAMAAALRTRIQELHEQLGIRFPVYVLVTKADLLAGFMEFFSEYGREERVQVWGVTFPFTEETEKNPLPALAAELVALERRLDDRLVDRLQQERDPQKRALIYNLPQQFGALRHLLADFLAQVFEPSNFQIQPMVRGVYFTSGTQEGSPIDRIMGQLSRAFGLEQKMLPPGQPSGKAYFITRLIRDVILAEAGIAGTNLRWERQRSVLQWAVVSLVAIVALGMAAAWTVSYSSNKAYIADVERNMQEASKQLAGLQGRRDTDVLALLPILGAVRDLASTAQATTDNVPLSMGFGLYQGDKLGAAAKAAYRRLLQDAFLPRLQARIEQLLRSGAQNPELLYEGLKAYIMLGDARHFDPEALKLFITADWEATLPRDVTGEQRKELVSHLNALLSQGAVSSPIAPDAQLIATARDALARTPLAQRIYNRLKRQGVGGDLPEFTITRAGGPNAALVFIRASGQPLTKGVPGLYSYNGYYKAFIPASELVGSQFANEEDWVLGATASGPGKLLDLDARLRLNREVRRLYLEEYARTWEAFVNDIKLIPAPGLAEAIQSARILSEPESPLPLLVKAIVEQVTLVKPDSVEKDIIDKATAAVTKKRDELMKLLDRQADRTGTAGPQRLESIVDERFTRLRRLATSAPGQPAAIDGTVALMRDVYQMLLVQQAAAANNSTPPPSEVPLKVKAEAGQLPEPVQSMLLALAQSGMTRVQEATFENINRAMATEIGDYCDDAIAGRYPFVRTSSRDVTQDGFTQLFKPGGVIDDFFQKKLVPMVDTTARPWKLRQVGDTPSPAPSQALLQFQRARTIRDVFFRGNPTPGFRLDFKPLQMDASITQIIIDIDGQLVTYSHGPQVRTAVQWPAAAGSLQARIQLAPPVAGGTSAQLFEGPWAMFRMFDRATIEATGQPERFIVTFNIDKRRATFEVTTNSVQNPLRLAEIEQFVCPAKL